MCRTLVTSADDPLAHGLYWSVLFLGSMPFLLVGSVGGWLVYAHRRAARGDSDGDR